MADREIPIPRLLQPLHGERSTARTLVATYSTGAVAGAFVCLMAVTSRPYAWWRLVLLFLVAADVSAGVVANFSAPTDSYYAARPGRRLPFVLFHVVHPAVLFAAFADSLPHWIFLFLYTATATLLVGGLRERHSQEMFAGSAVAFGIVIMAWFGPASPQLLWFPPLFMVKLILAFAVRRTP